MDFCLLFSRSDSLKFPFQHSALRGLFSLVLFTHPVLLNHGHFSWARSRRRGPHSPVSCKRFAAAALLALVYRIRQHGSGVPLNVRQGRSGAVLPWRYHVPSQNLGCEAIRPRGQEKPSRIPSPLQELEEHVCFTKPIFHRKRSGCLRLAP